MEELLSTAVDCGNLTDPQNGTVTVPSTIFQSVADYRCDIGFVLNGTLSRTCQSDGIWSANEPSCQGTTVQLCPASIHSRFILE